MTREDHIRFYEALGVNPPKSTRLNLYLFGMLENIKHNELNIKKLQKHWGSLPNRTDLTIRNLVLFV